MRFLLIWINIFVLLHHPKAQTLGTAAPRGRDVRSSEYRGPFYPARRGLPNEGYFDSFHSSIGLWPKIYQWRAQTSRFNSMLIETPFQNAYRPWPLDPFSKTSPNLLRTVYALRRIKTEEFLMSRKGYLELLDPEKTTSPYPAVPPAVKNIFLNGEHKIFEINHLVGQLEEGSSRGIQERKDNRKKIFKSLSTSAIALSQMDRLIRFLSSEIFEDNPSYRKMQNDLAVKYGRGRISYWSGFAEKNRAKATEILNEKLYEQLKIPQALENILAQRTYYLNLHPLLGVQLEEDEEGNKCPHLYQCIYRTLQQELELPDLRGRLSSAHIDFTKAVNIDLGDTFQRQGARNMELLVQHRERVYPLVTPLFDRAIHIALEGNFKFLEELCSERSFEANPVPYLIMALDESNWNKLFEENHFFWVNPEVFEKGKKELMEILKAEGNREKFVSQSLRYFGYGLIGVGALSWLTGGGAPIGAGVMGATKGFLLGIRWISLGALRGSGARFAGKAVLNHIKVGAAASTRAEGARKVSRAIFRASGVSFAGKAVWDYLNYRRYGKLAQQLYVGSVQQSSYDIQQDDRLILTRDYRDAAYAVANAILFYQGPMVKTLGILFRPIVVAGRGTVAVSQRGMTFLRGHLSALEGSVLVRLPYYRQVLDRAHRALNFTSLRAQQGLSRLIGRNAAQAGVSPHSIRAIVAENPLIQRAIDRMGGVFKNRFVRREVMVELLAAIAAEIIVRKDKFLEEFDYVLLNVLFSIGVTFSISTQTHMANVGNVKSIFPRGVPFSLKRSGINWGLNSLQLSIAAIAIAGLLNGTLLMWSIIKGEEVSEEDVKMALESVFWMSVTCSLSSPPRSQFVKQKINPAIDNLYSWRYPNVAKSKLAKWAEDVKIPISIGNNTIGIYLMSKTLRDWSGIQTDDKIYGKDLVYSYNEFNDRNANYLFPVILETGK